MRCAEKVADAYRLGQRDALSAARDAVSLLPMFDWFPAVDARENVLAAIDALRESND